MKKNQVIKGSNKISLEGIQLNVISLGKNFILITSNNGEIYHSAGAITTTPNSISIGSGFLDSKYVEKLLNGHYGVNQWELVESRKQSESKLGNMTTDMKEVNVPKIILINGWKELVIGENKLLNLFPLNGNMILVKHLGQDFLATSVEVKRNYFLLRGDYPSTELIKKCIDKFKGSSYWDVDLSEGITKMESLLWHNRQII